jgi:RimJ/RimL family protein N-acetyltransferase
MLLERQSIHLLDATPAVVETHQPPFAPELARAVAQLWQDAFGATEYGVRRLLGEYAEYEQAARDYLFLVRLDDRPDPEARGPIVGTAWYVVPADNPRVGLLGGVLALPSARRRGIATIATRACVDHFERQGGQAIYLGTVNPDAWRVYEKLGFTTYSGVVRRALVGEAREFGDTFDANYFRVAGPTSVRAATWGDQAGVSALYFGPHSTVLLDAPTGTFARDASPLSSCVGFYPRLWDSTLGRAGRLAVLLTDDRRVLGTLALHRRLAAPEAHRATLDFCVAPSAADRAEQLLAFAREEARRLELTSLEASACERDASKLAALTRAGFRAVALVPEAFEIAGTAHGRVTLLSRLDSAAGPR